MRVSIWLPADLDAVAVAMQALAASGLDFDPRPVRRRADVPAAEDGLRRVTRPPDDLKDWSKNELVREIRRLRAIMREHSEQVSPSHSGGNTVDVAGDPYAKGGVVIDARGAVLLDSTEVVLVDTKRDDEPVRMLLRLAGRINYSDERADTAYFIGTDGAAALVSEIVGLAARAGTVDERFAHEFQADLQRRMGELP